MDVIFERVKRPYLYFILLIIGAGMVAGGALFAYNSEFFQDAVLKGNVNKKTFIAPFKLLPYVSAAEARKTICSTVKTSRFKKICNKKYNRVTKDDTKKIDSLFLVLDQIKNNKKVTDYDKFLLSQLVFATLPAGTDVISKLPVDIFQANVLDSALVAQSGTASSTSRAAYENLLLRDLATIRENCPQPGYENWTLTVMCSEHSWVSGVRQPIYSKQYGESGGPCMFSEAGAIEGYRTQSILNTKMSSEYNFSESPDVSNQIACSFSCGSFNCPALDEEIGQDLACKNPIYIPHPSLRRVEQLPERELEFDFEEARSDCEERGYRYTTRADGSTERTKTRDCRLGSKSITEVRKNPPANVPMVYSSFCCECDRPINDPYVSAKDYTEDGYTGIDLLDWLMKGVKDYVAPPPVQDAPAPPPVQDITSSPPPPEQPPVTTPVQDITPTVSTPAPAVTTAPVSTTPPAGVTLKFRFTCDVTKELSPGPSYARYYFFTLDAKTQLTGDAGGLQEVKALDSLGATNACYSLTEKVPQCIDPRTNTPSDVALDFTKEFTNVTQSDVVQVNYEVYSWLYTMSRGTRQCKVDELQPS